MFVKVLIITAVFLALSIAGIAIKLFVKKDGEFKKQCSSVNPNTGERMGCSCEKAEGSCENKTIENPA